MLFFLLFLIALMIISDIETVGFFWHKTRRNRSSQFSNQRAFFLPQYICQAGLITQELFHVIFA